MTTNQKSAKCSTTASIVERHQPQRHGLDLQGPISKPAKHVAVKVPFMQFESDPAFFSRFQREEEIGQCSTTRISCTSFPSRRRSRPYIAMELLEGKTLRQVMRSMAKCRLSRRPGIASRICEALDYMHQQKAIVHRDLKPENIMLCHDGSCGSWISASPRRRPCGA